MTVLLNFWTMCHHSVPLSKIQKPKYWKYSSCHFSVLKSFETRLATTKVGVNLSPKPPNLQKLSAHTPWPWQGCLFNIHVNNMEHLCETYHLITKVTISKCIPPTVQCLCSQSKLTCTSQVCTATCHISHIKDLTLNIFNFARAYPCWQSRQQNKGFILG